MSLILLAFLISLYSASDFCFDKAFANQTNITSCKVTGRQYLSCEIFGIGAGYKSLFMSCDESLNYNLPIGIDGGDTAQTQELLNSAMLNLSTTFNTTIVTNCVTKPHTQFDWVFKTGIRNYNEIVCTITVPQDETLPELPDDYICSGNIFNAGLGHIIGTLIIFLIIF